VADNTTQGGSDTIATDDLTTLNGGAVSGVKAQRVKVGYGSDGSLRDVDTSNGLPIQGVQDAAVTGTITTAAGNSTSVAVTSRNIVTFYVVLTGTTPVDRFQLQASPDGGTTWFPISAVDNATGRAGTTWTLSGAGSVASYDTAVGGFTHVRIANQAISGTGATLTYGVIAQVFAYEPAVSAFIQQPARTQLTYSAVGVASGATGVETAITLTRSAGTAATTTGASFVITAGKTFRITAIILASQGHATATTQNTTFSLRVNTAGAVATTTTPVILSARTSTPATSLAWDRFPLDLGGEGLEILGDGTLQWGLTANAVFVTNAPTWNVTIVGYEY
jgi:hypothetical protein